MVASKKNLLSQLLHGLKGSPAWLLFLHNKSASQDLVCSWLVTPCRKCPSCWFPWPPCLTWTFSVLITIPYLHSFWSPLFSTFSASCASDLIFCPYYYITFIANKYGLAIICFIQFQGKEVERKQKWRVASQSNDGYYFSYIP